MSRVTWIRLNGGQGACCGAGPELPFPHWQGEALKGKSLLIWPQQGFGDYIQFARFLPLLKLRGISTLTVAGPPSLRTLLERIDGVDAWIDSDNPVDLLRHDYWCFVMSLPLHLGTTLTSIPARLPYLSAPAERVLYWRQRLPEGSSAASSGLESRVPISQLSMR
jgi:hypothetical protein